MKIQLKDGAVRNYEKPITVIKITKELSEGLARVACAGEVNGNLVDLRYEINEDSSLSILTFEDEKGKSSFRHTTSHILAQAIKRLYPGAKLAIGPAIEDGFYYDFDFEKAISNDDLSAIENEMKKIVKENFEIKRFTLNRDEAIAFMKKRGEDYKVQLINDLPKDEEISFYEQGDFVDLCAGPHLLSTKYVKAFKLTSVAGAYWRGNEKNKMLTRIYGTSFPKSSELEEYLTRMEEAKKRDHRKLGKELGLFTLMDEGPGFPFFLPKGMILKNLLIDYWRKIHERERYVEISTPMMLSRKLWETSGHWDHYKDGMFVLGEEEKDKEVFALRPMTCPFQYYVYKASQKSYRDLPCRYGETSTLFRNEDSGEMHGLTRVRQFTISEGHLIVRPDQMVEEFKNCIALAQYCLQTLGLEEDVTYHLSKWDPENREKYIGEPEVWNETEQDIRNVLNELNIPFVEDIGEAAFYGPKVDINAKNVYGKEDTMITIQWDALLAEQFDMYYIDENGEKKRPYIIHRTSIGCYERTLAWLIEKYAGKFPTWLCPEQVRVLPISDKYVEYADKVAAELKKNGIDVTVDSRSEKIGYKIREARLDKLPYMLVVGQQEEADETVSVRSRFAGDEGVKPLDEFIEQICKEIRTKEIRKVEVEENK